MQVPTLARMLISTAVLLAAVGCDGEFLAPVPIITTGLGQPTLPDTVGVALPDGFGQVIPDGSCGTRDAVQAARSAALRLPACNRPQGKPARDEP